MNISAIFGGVAIIAWIVAVAIVIVVIFQAVRGRPIKNSGAIVGIIILGAIVLSTVSAGLVFIKPEERGVVISAISPGGYRPQALTPGLRWIVPFAESVVTYPISKQTYTMSVAPSEGQNQGDDSIESRTSDGQKVNIDASVIYSIDPDKVVQIHLTWQNRYGNDLVRAVTRGIIRDAVSQFKVEEVYSTKRLELTQTIHDKLEKELSDNSLILHDFVLRNISFSPEYATSIEEKQIAEQKAEQAKFVVEQKIQEADQAREVAKGQRDAAITEAEGEKQARILQAEGEAQALQLINQAIKDNPQLLSYLYISKLSPNIQVMLLPSNSPFIYNLPNLQTVVTPTPVTPTEVPTLEPTPLPTPTQAPTPQPTATP